MKNILGDKPAGNTEEQELDNSFEWNHKLPMTVFPSLFIMSCSSPKKLSAKNIDPHHLQGDVLNVLRQPIKFI